MKTSGMRRALALAGVFNLLVAVYFIVISVVSLVKLRWYHRLTITTKVRHLITSPTSYFAFLILLAVAIVLIAIFVIGTSRLSTKLYISSFRNQDAATSRSHLVAPAASSPIKQPAAASNPDQYGCPQFGSGPSIMDQQQQQKQPLADGPVGGRFIEINDIRDGSSGELPGQAELPHIAPAAGASDSCNFCSMLLNLIAAIGLIVIIVVWLLNTGELVRDSVSTQLDFALARYQFSNRSNHYSVAIDAMQSINECCGSLEYTDFPHRVSGLSPGHYPGSCCGKQIYAVMTRVLCVPEEIVRKRQTIGCVIAISNLYDLVSLLIVPVALASLFVCIMVMAMMTLLKGHNNDSGGHHLQHNKPLNVTSSHPILSHHRGLFNAGSTSIQPSDKLSDINTIGDSKSSADDNHPQQPTTVGQEPVKH